eukprot:TRINITY_DN4920_c0_g1_i1.p1 TRINITY_DN4920_c0_g1~~TRINITY_DN4920_c0_g1_i1.p1  ORF type:complete len:517 (-),score=144.86 TRINITY_DN4920_c0_g1_i1:18-1568(-)
MEVISKQDIGLPVNQYTIKKENLKINECIGSGSFGAVYKGSYLGTEVAIKLIKKEELRQEEILLRFLQREIASLKFNHPNCVQFIGICDKDDEDLYLVTEFVAGGDLRKYLKDKDYNLPWKMRIKLSYDAACALAYLHVKGLIHRDLKSKNLLVSSDWKIKVCDFGFARTAPSGRERRPMTICGTQDWMAPEVMLGMPYNQKADVFSYGIVLFEIITRRKVSEFLQRDAQDGFAVNKKKFMEFVPKDAPSDFVNLAFECCSVEIDERPEFTEILDRLNNMEKEMPSQLPKITSKIIQSPNTVQLSRQSGLSVFKSKIYHHVEPNNNNNVKTYNTNTINSSQSKIQPKRVEGLKITRRNSSGFISTLNWDKLTTLGFDNPSQLDEAVNKLKSPSSLSGWVLIGYKSANMLFFKKEGTGGPEQLLEEFKDNEVLYALLRVPVSRDEIIVGKSTWDIFVSWIGPKINIVTKGKVKGLLGQVMDLMRPYHADLVLINKENFDLKNILAKADPKSGSHIID